MKKYLLILAAILVLSVICLTSAVSAEDTQGDYAQASSTIDVSARAIGDQIADEIIVVVNQKRADNGLSAVTKNSVLTDVAEYQCAEMKQHHFFQHETHEGYDFFWRADHFGYIFNTAYWGENIGKGVPDRGTPTRIAKKFVNKWMKKTADRNNILNSHVTRIGVGVVWARIGHSRSWVSVLDLTA